MGVWCHQFFLMRKARARSCLPRGGRDHRCYGQRPASRILIPHSMGGGQFARLPPYDNINISIHLPRGGVGRPSVRPRRPSSNFKPPTPWGVGLGGLLGQLLQPPISIHPPRGGWDSKSVQKRACTFCAIDKVCSYFRSSSIWQTMQSPEN